MSNTEKTPVNRRAALADAVFGLSVLGFVIAATGMLLAADFRELVRSAAYSDFSRNARTPVTLQRPTDGDQVRPYLPFTRPVAPGQPRVDITREPSASERAPMVFSMRDGRIRAEGTIASGTSEEFGRLVAGLEEGAAAGTARPAEIVIHSPGGNVAEAMALSRLIRSAGLATRIEPDGYCASACPLVFAGGTERHASAEAWVGVHRVYAPAGIFGTLEDGIGEAQRIAAEAQDLLVEMGVDPVVWTHAMRTPKEQLYFFTADELADLKLATAVD